MAQTKTRPQRDWLDFSLRSIIVILVGVSLFIWYVVSLLFGENSLSVLNKLENEKEALSIQSKSLKLSNQELQKKYFELIQLSGDQSLY
jgi:cell division protein FtsB